MSVIKVTLPLGEIPVEGKQVSFKAPCPCHETEAIQIEGENYTVCDSLGKCVTGVGGVWDVGSMVSVILSVEQKKAYIQNQSHSPLFTATVTTVWQTDGQYFYQDIEVDGIMETDTPTIGVRPGEDNAANVAYSVAISNVFRATTSANSIRVWARSKPSIAFPIQIKAVR